jgi:hypothetical protein
LLALISRLHVTDVGTAMTRGDTAMNWDQIENKWATMTRRIRSDWSPERIDATRDSKWRIGKADLAIADGQKTVRDETGAKFLSK